MGVKLIKSNYGFPLLRALQCNFGPVSGITAAFTTSFGGLLCRVKCGSKVTRVSHKQVRISAYGQITPLRQFEISSIVQALVHGSHAGSAHLYL